jgi:hypothetical protein
MLLVGVLMTQVKGTMAIVATPAAAQIRQSLRRAARLFKPMYA